MTKRRLRSKTTVAAAALPCMPLRQKTTVSRDHPGRAAGPSPISMLTRVAQEANAAYRSHMEDSAVVVDPFMAGECPGDSWSYFAVYDGHGGRQAVDLTEARLHSIVLDELRGVVQTFGGCPSDEAIAEVLSRSFQRIDDQLKAIGAWHCGCTCTVVLAHKTSGGLRLHAANVGDSRAVSLDPYGEIRISRDHRPSDPAEIQRVESEGGFVSRGRVSGQLGVSRALGDHALKSAGVTWRPYIHHRDASRDSTLIICSDGVWDAITDADARVVIEHCMADHTHDQAAESLLREACRLGSTDNITVLTAFFGRHSYQGGRPRSGGA
eukprot:TRINITY_DN5605_c0_g2_i2.p1 TRINITY_DN5605_c0_g2~~TRINITY_DN5605_c0_g2_i2.p1  ORF type:complete len:324 (-),score=35.75 TRINITY_DN5605_c0_g2_i2:149-1120(-)